MGRLCRHPYTSVVAPCRHPTCTNMFEIRVPVNALIHFSFGCRKCPRATQATHLLRKNARTQRTQPPCVEGRILWTSVTGRKNEFFPFKKIEWALGPSAVGPRAGSSLAQDCPCAGGSAQNKRQNCVASLGSCNARPCAGTHVVEHSEGPH